MKERIAIIGTGVAGLGCAWQLRDLADITLIEREARPGGHSNTVEVEEDGKKLRIDSGFIVFNRVTYPNLVRLFEELGVHTKPSEMSFSVQHLPEGLEYNGMGPDKIFAQRRNLLRPRFYRLIYQILRFFRLAQAALDDPSTESLTVREFTKKHRLGKDFLDFYLVPMSSAVWSTEPDRMLDFPALSLLRFFHNHGFLGVTTHHPWFTVSEGSRSYVEKILAAVRPVRLPAKVVSVSEQAGHVTVRTANGESEDFDRVVIAAHANEALEMLESPDPAQARLLSAFGYQSNVATLHTDESVMPIRKKAWASWNYRMDKDPQGNVRATTHYWMNALQGVSDKRNYFLSLNSRESIPADKVLYETVYDHPVYTLEAMQAQEELPSLNRRSPGQRVFFCGSYFRYGFHEDAYASAVNLSNILRPLLEK
ncbi:MAG: NAD(P)/FAD-dependent oxidoreductase [Terrimicrobiaceae bacterium]